MAAVHQMTGLANVAQASNITRYFFPGAGPPTATATEAQRQVKCRVPGSCSKMYIKVTANDRPNSAMRFRKNTANGTQLVTITSSTTGYFEDLSGSDNLADGDVFNYSLTTGNGGTTFTFSALGHLFDATTNSCQYLLCHIGNNIGASEVAPINGGQSGTLEDGVLTKLYAPNGGTFKKFQAYVTTNTRDGACTADFHHNASVVATVTITAATTGYFEDLSYTQAVFFDDTASWEVTRGGTTGNCTVQYLGVCFESVEGESLICACGGNNTHGVSTNTYYVIHGSVANGSTTEADARTQARLPTAYHKLKIYCQTNTISAASSMTLRINGVDSGVSVVIDASTTGEFEDMVLPAAALATDEVCLRLTTGGSGTALAFRNFQMGTAPYAPEYWPPLFRSTPRFFSRKRRYV